MRASVNLCRETAACLPLAQCTRAPHTTVSPNTTARPQEAEAGWADLAPEVGEVACELGEALWEALLDDTAALLAGRG